MFMANYNNVLSNILILYLTIQKKIDQCSYFSASTKGGIVISTNLCVHIGVGAGGLQYFFFLKLLSGINLFQNLCIWLNTFGCFFKVNRDPYDKGCHL